MTRHHNVHVIENDPIIVLSLEALLDCAGFAVTTHGSASDLLGCANPGDVDCVVADVDVPGPNGLDLKRLLTQHGVECPVLVITGGPSSATPGEAAASGASACFHKPIAASAIIPGVRKACSATA